MCVPAWNGGPHETKDAITLGVLELLISSLYGLGYDIDSPVTLLYDADHVWLETVEFDPPEERSPRVVNELAPELRESQWDTPAHGRYHWSGGDEEYPWSRTHNGITSHEYRGDLTAGPYTEVIE